MEGEQWLAVVFEMLLSRRTEKIGREWKRESGMNE